MTSDEADLRIDHSRRVLTEWTLAGPEGKPEDVMRMINEEITILAGMGEAHPGKVPRLLKLVNQWVTFRHRMRSKLNRQIALGEQ